jgi:hypothetical protein
LRAQCLDRKAHQILVPDLNRNAGGDQRRKAHQRIRLTGTPAEVPAVATGLDKYDFPNRHGPIYTEASIARRSSFFSLRGTTVRQASRALRPKFIQNSFRPIARATYFGRQ